MIYVDTSFIVSAYGQDVNTTEACAYLSSHEVKLPLNFLHWPELAGSLWKNYTDAEARWKIIEADLLDDVNICHVSPDAGRVGRRAAGLMKGFCRRWPKLRALDVMHVAAAVEIQAKTFLSFDSRSYQRALAHTQGLKVWPALATEEKSWLK